MALFFGIFIALNLSSRDDNGDDDELGAALQDMIDQDIQEVQVSIFGSFM